MADPIPLWNPHEDAKQLAKKLQEHTGSIMGKLVRRSSQTAGLAPGTMVHVGKKKMEKPQFRLIDFTPKKVIDEQIISVEEAFPFKKKPTVTWLDTVGLHETEHITKLGTHFDLHTLIQEDIVNTTQRPSFEDYGKYLFITLKMLSKNHAGIEAEHVSLVIGKNFVLSFQERPGDVFEGVRKRIHEKRKIIERGSDYLAYALIDAIVDQYFLILEHIAERMEELEDELNDNPSKTTFRNISALKRELIFTRKSVWPLREVLNNYKKTESKIVHRETKAFINDVYDHTIQVIDTVESLRDVAANMTDVYLSTISNKMNEIMKVLTIFAAIFIPLTFIAGVYGMNFDHMPELATRYGYYIVWGVFLLVGIGMLGYFKKKDWL